MRTQMYFRGQNKTGEKRQRRLTAVIIIVAVVDVVLDPIGFLSTNALAYNTYIHGYPRHTYVGPA